MSYAALGAVVLAFLLDRLFAEFPEPVHPVALFGRAVAPLDREWPAPRLAGAGIALVLPLVAAAVVGGAVWLGGGAPLPAPVPLVAAALLAGVVLFATTSLGMLLDVAREVVDLTDGDPGAARDRLRALAGRDASALSPAQVRSAAVESAAENLADGLVAPLFAFAVAATLASGAAPGAPAGGPPETGAVFGVAVGAGAAAWVKAVNTLDSMLGYPAKPHGTASALLDDVVMVVPARLAALLVAAAALEPDATARARAWAQAPPSPNSGWPMGTLAAALGVRLEKPGAYVLNEVGTLPDAETARAGVRIVGRAGVLAWLLAGVVAWY
jgi:adenosylcobinamide-phosphate synthase